MWESFVFSIEMMERLAKQVIPSITIKDERGVSDGTHCSIDESGNPIIHWDSLMYDLYEKELTLLDTFPYKEGADDKIISEMKYNYLGVLLNHLSEKHKRDPFICDSLKQKAHSYHYTYFEYMNNKLPEVSEWKNPLFIQTGVFKLLIMYHEIAHCLFSKNNDEKKKWENLVVYNLSMLHEHKTETLLFASDNIKRRKAIHILLKKLRKREEDILDLLEELAADTYAMSKAYATTHLNINVVDEQYLSDNIMMAYLRYVDISSQYGLIVNYWQELYSMYITHRKKTVIQEDTLLKISAKNAVRCGILGFISLINIIQFDVETWNYTPTKDISLSDPRIQNCIDIFTTNATFLSECTTASINPVLFNSILEDAYKLKQTNSPHFEYPVIPEGTLVITWLSIQYYNNRGLEKFNDCDYIEALKDFRLANSMIEKYLGHNHRLTARGINNICSCYLGLAKSNPLNDDDDDGLKFLENLELASYHSSNAIDILKNTNSIEELQAGAILQNAAEIMTLMGRDEDALIYYFKAKAVKEKNHKEYSQTHALTDFSIACAYYRLKKYSEAKNSCIKALEFYRRYAAEDDPARMNIESLYMQIEYMLNPPSGALFDIISLLNNGKTVNLDQYNNWD